MAVGHEGQEIMIKDALVFLVAAGLVVPILRALKIVNFPGLSSIVEFWKKFEILVIRCWNA